MPIIYGQILRKKVRFYNNIDLIFNLKQKNMYKRSLFIYWTALVYPWSVSLTAEKYIFDWFYGY